MTKSSSTNAVLKPRDISVKYTKLLIDGQWKNAVSGRTFTTIHPATGEAIAEIAEADKADVDLAVRAARKAFEEGPWKKMGAKTRAALLHKIADAIEKNAEELARLETLDTGKPISQSRAVDVPMAVQCFRYYAGWTDKILGETIPVEGNYFNYTLREPVGVVGQIIPWNFPLMLASWKTAPALACGNTIVLKPAEQTPLTALYLGALCMEAGLPQGVIKVAPGFGPTAGAALSGHMDVDKIAFTGEVTTGKEIMKAAACNLKRVSLELGGKAPNIVFADADLPTAVKASLDGIYLNQGEVCCSGSRLFVQDKVHDEFVAMAKGIATQRKVGNPLDPATEQGSQNSKDQYEKILRYIDIGKKEARLVCGGEPAKVNDGKGYFIKPTVFDGVTNQMRIAREEIFGPVLSVLRFRDAENLVAQANDTIFGLSAGLWTRDIARAHNLARAIKAGTVWINCYDCFDSASPFGGYKQSGFGRDLSHHCLEQYTQIKSVWVNLE